MLLSQNLPAQEPGASAAISLEQLTEKADLVAVGQVKDADYAYRRGYPVSGSAYLKVLIPYKTNRPNDIIEVYEQGLHENECYFPNPDVFEEGRRYLLFLQQDPEKPERYRGLPEGCALDVLVSENNQYALRLPASGMDLSDPLAELAQDMKFGDRYALENENTLSSTEQKILLASGLISPYEPAATETKPGIFGQTQSPSPDKRWTYTQGIDLAVIRELMGLKGLSPER